VEVLVLLIILKEHLAAHSNCNAVFSLRIYTLRRKNHTHPEASTNALLKCGDIP